MEENFNVKECYEKFGIGGFSPEQNEVKAVAS
jgi:hypothetical protein